MLCACFWLLIASRNSVSAATGLLLSAEQGVQHQPGLQGTPCCALPPHCTNQRGLGVLPAAHGPKLLRIGFTTQTQFSLP